MECCKGVLWRSVAVKCCREMLEKWWCFCGGVFVAVFLRRCFCGGVFVVVWRCFCGGAVVFLCFCGGVFVVVFLWRCFCGGVVVFLWGRKVVAKCCAEVL